MVTPAQSEYLSVMADGTVKQRHPISDNEVWTVPGRGHRPLGTAHPHPQPLEASEHGRHCAFCEHRYLETPPEKSRFVRDGDRWTLHRHLPATQLFDSVAEFRCIPNLFEILSYEYWHANHGYELSSETKGFRDDYLAEPAGREHVLAVARAKMRASGLDAGQVESTPEAQVLDHASGFFGGGHNVVVARRHFVDGATDTSQLAGSGTLSVEEHRRYVEFTVLTLQRLQHTIPQSQHVAVFQNWLKPAGASFDHLHKQLVAIDSYGSSNKRTIIREINEPGFFNTRLMRAARTHDLVLARNEHAIAIAGFGHRYPTIKVFSTSATCDPVQQSRDEVDAMSDLVHAMHAATGAEVACNEEWHQRPPAVGVRLPWFVNIKWRISTLAGFEGGTKISLNTIAPATLKERLLPRLVELRDQGTIAPISIGDECRLGDQPLEYHLGG